MTAYYKPAQRLFPIEPLLAAAKITVGQLARAVNANGSAVHQAALYGLTVSEADRWAIRLGHHPATVWPEWVDVALQGAAA